MSRGESCIRPQHSPVLATLQNYVIPNAVRNLSVLQWKIIEMLRSTGFDRPERPSFMERHIALLGFGFPQNKPLCADLCRHAPHLCRYIPKSPFQS